MLGGHGGLAVGARARSRAERAEEPAVPARPARLGCQAAVPRCIAQGQYLPHIYFCPISVSVRLVTK